VELITLAHTTRAQQMQGASQLSLLLLGLSGTTRAEGLPPWSDA